MKFFAAYVGMLLEIPCYGMVFYSHCKNIMLNLKKRVQFTFISFLFCYSFLYVSVYAQTDVQDNVDIYGEVVLQKQLTTFIRLAFLRKSSVKEI